MNEGKTFFGKLWRKAAKILVGQTPAGPIVETLRGIVKGTSNVTGVSTLLSFLDVNEDGKVDMKDFKEISWQYIGKLAAVGTLVYLAMRFGILNL